MHLRVILIPWLWGQSDSNPDRTNERPDRIRVKQEGVKNGLAPL